MSKNTGKLNSNGSLSLTGHVVVKGADGTVLFDGDKTWLCRCGHSKNKPFCDGSHKAAGFAHDGNAPPCATAELAAGHLTVTAKANGPLQVDGPLVLHGADGAPIYCDEQTWLCRCGASKEKPFCDGSHKAIGFTA